MKYYGAVPLGPCLALCLFVATEGMAQEATSFEQLQVLVKAGDEVSVTDVAGRVTKGKIDVLSRSSLRLLQNRVSRELSAADVLEIKRGDSLRNGARTGALVGAGFGAGFGVLFGIACGSYECAAALVPLCIGINAGIGAGIGVGIDAMTNRSQTIYRAPARTPSAGIRITPLLSSERKGVLVSVSF